jgi:hypothetical protein
MEPPYSFAHINIRACWPASDRDYYRYLDQVTPKGYQCLSMKADHQGYVRLGDFGRREITEQGVLQVCLLSMALFQDCAQDQLRDMRSPSQPRALQCQNRPLLIEVLAGALLAYEEAMEKHAQFMPNWHEWLCQSLKGFEALAEAYDILRARRVPAVVMPNGKRLSSTQLNKKIADLAHLVKALETDPYRQQLSAMSASLSERNTLVQQMHDALRSHGPGAGDYRKEVAYAAIHHVLSGLEIIPRPMTTAAIRKILDSGRKRAAS